MNKTLENIIKYVLTTITVTIMIALVLLVVSPVIYFLGWCTGWFAMVTIGDILVGGINTIFGTSFAKDILPTLGGVLTWIGCFFKSSKVTSNRDNK